MCVQLCKVPCDTGSVAAMAAAMRTGPHRWSDDTISWDDFRAYMAGEFAAGRNMLSGTYVLPSGQARRLTVPDRAS